MPRVIVITGTNTGSGKTVLTALLARYLRKAGVPAAAIKPICSGGRADAHALLAACDSLHLDEINPWHFRAALAPLLAARREKQTVTLHDVVAHVRAMAHRFDPVLVEGAGGLLSPLGEHFSTRELIATLNADVIVAAKNELGVVNQARLTLEALPPLVRPRVRFALMAPKRENIVSRTNRQLLAEFTNPENIFPLPWFARPQAHDSILNSRRVESTLAALIH